MKIGIFNEKRYEMALQKLLLNNHEIIPFPILDKTQSWQKEIRSLDALILPFKVTKNMQLKIHTDQVINLCQFIDELDSETLLFCGLNVDANIDCIQLMKHPKYLSENAKMTAQGVLAMLLEHTEQLLEELEVDIIGYGNCGRAIYKILQPFNMHLRIVSNQKDAQLPIISYENYLEHAKIMINTQDQILFDQHILKHPLILDIATHSNFENLDVNLIRCGSLPTKYTQLSDQKSISQALLEKLVEYE